MVVSSFSKDWWAWWRVLNPVWRVRDGELVREGTGSWDNLRRPGKNGLLNIMACLKWWHGRLKSDLEREDWMRAQVDILWVLQSMLGYVKGLYSRRFKMLTI